MAPTRGFKAWCPGTQISAKTRAFDAQVLQNVVKHEVWSTEASETRKNPMHAPKSPAIC